MQVELFYLGLCWDLVNTNFIWFLPFLSCNFMNFSFTKLNSLSKVATCISSITALGPHSHPFEYWKAIKPVSCTYIIRAIPYQNFHQLLGYFDLIRALLFSFFLWLVNLLEKLFMWWVLLRPMLKTLRRGSGCAWSLVILVWHLVVMTYHIHI